MAIISSGIYPINPNITDGTQLASYINELVEAINSQQLSNTRPPMITKGGVWSKQVSDTEIAVMLYDGAQDVQVASIVGGESSTNGGGGGGEGIPEAPIDGLQYARQDAGWTEVIGSETATLESLGIPNHDKVTVDENGQVTIQTSSTNTSAFDFGMQLNNSHASNDSITALGFHNRADVNSNGVGGAIAFVGGGASAGSGSITFNIKDGSNINNVVGLADERMRISADGRVDISGSLYVNGSEVGGGSAKAFSKMAVYNHSGGSIRKQTGLSSISKSGNLILVFNFSGATTDANYFVSAMHGRGTKSDDGNCAVGLAPNGSGNLPSTTKCTVAYCEGGTAAPLNSTHCMFGLAEI